MEGTSRRLRGLTSAGGGRGADDAARNLRSEDDAVVAMLANEAFRSERHGAERWTPETIAKVLASMSPDRRLRPNEQTRRRST